MLKRTLCLWVVLCSFQVGASEMRPSFLPPNNLDRYDRLDRPSQVTEADFNQITDRIVAFYQPLAKLHKGTLTAEKRWTDSTVNAYANRTNKDTTWEIHMFGGLARRPEMTKDGFALVVCHELGHQFGGSFFSYTRIPIFFWTLTQIHNWAAAEGQSDYYSTQVCARAMWKDEGAENAKAVETVDPFARQKCDQVWGTVEERNLCYRSANGAASLAALLHALAVENKVQEDEPHFSTPSQKKVKVSDPSHPASQCRLDTLFAGALCTKSFEIEKIPGLRNKDGKNSASAEREAANVSCAAVDGFKDGVRPGCWFKPLLTKKSRSALN